MISDDSWTASLWHQHFDPVAGEDGQLEQMEGKAYWGLFESDMRDSFPKEAFFRMESLLGQEDLEQRAHTVRELSPPTHSFFCALRIQGELAAMFCGQSHTPNIWRMWNTVVHHKFRRRGIYNRIIRGHVGYSKALGFDMIRSEHAMCNNAILVAKLSRGFQISALLMDPGYGPTLELTYFHRPEQHNAYLFRCGMANMTPALLASGNEPMRELKDQFVQADRNDPKPPQS